MFRTTIFAAIAAVAGFGALQAAPISGAASGLSGADVMIDFSEKGDLQGTDITTQFSDLGVTFSPFLRQLDEAGYAARGNHSGFALFNFKFDPDLQFADPFSIMFNNAVSAATFALSGSNNNNTATGTLTALLNGTVVESFTATLQQPAPNFFGFSGIVFDEITVDATFPRGTSIDNLAFNLAPVPLPAGLPLMLAGLGAFALIRRKA